jgi:hypothetical protein
VDRLSRGRHFGIDYHPEHVRRVLKRRMSWTSQKPQKHARECNDNEPRALRVGLHFMPLGDNENFHGEEVVLFLRQLKGEVGGPWTIVSDRNQIPGRSRVVKAWLADHSGVVTEDFPAHAPDTNPDEVWSWTKYGRLCNLAPADVAELRQHVWDTRLP